jgi:hypothetical protein
MRVFFDSWFYIRLSKMPEVEALALVDELCAMGVVAVTSTTLAKELIQSEHEEQNRRLTRYLERLPAVGLEGTNDGWIFLLAPWLVPPELQAMLKIDHDGQDQDRLRTLAERREIGLDKYDEMRTTFDWGAARKPALPAMKVAAAVLHSLPDWALPAFDAAFGGVGRGAELMAYANSMADENAELVRPPEWLIEQQMRNIQIDEAVYHAKPTPQVEGEGVTRKHRGHLGDASHMAAFIRNSEVIDLFFCDKKQHNKIEGQVDHPLKEAGLMDRVRTGKSAQDALNEVKSWVARQPG